MGVSEGVPGIISAASTEVSVNSAHWDKDVCRGAGVEH